jgi:LmbE family N-acetylglucosaminyl deacetylase
MKPMRCYPVVLTCLLSTLGLLAPPLGAQLRPSALDPASTGGIVRLDRALAKLSTHRRLLVVAAHPDDEDTTLLTLVSRGMGGEAAYFSLSRGEGGQNLIGPELGEGLGLIRSGELLAARDVDGARQFFSRGFDFGYTRSLDETLARWPKEILLEDAVRVIRRFRPQVIVAVFPPNAQAGHGQHQASGVIAGEAFAVAGDPQALPQLRAEGLVPWRPQAFYRVGWFNPEGEAVQFPLGLVDPLTGKSYLQTALASRSNHRSQDMGSVQPLGSRNNRLLPEAGVAATTGDDPFVGIDTRLAAIAALLPSEDPTRATVERALTAVEALALQARQDLAPTRLEGAVAPLVDIVGQLRTALAAVSSMQTATDAGSVVAALLREKLTVAEEGLATAAGVAVDAAADRTEWLPGEGGEVALTLWNSGDRSIEARGVMVETAADWAAERRTATEDPGAGSFLLRGLEALAAPPLPVALAQRQRADWVFDVAVPATAPPSYPYFLEKPRNGDLYDWSAVADTIRGEPFQAPLLTARFDLVIDGLEITLRREVVHRFADQAVGEIRRPLRVVPRLEVALSADLLVWPVAERGPHPIEVRLTNHGGETATGRLEIAAPEGWPPVAPLPFSVSPRGETVLTFPLTPPTAETGGTTDLAAGRYAVPVTAVLDEGQRFAAAARRITYPHIRTRLLPTPATVVVSAGDIRLPPGVERVGYVRGASDRVPEALRQIGVPLTVLSAEDLVVGDLSRFDTVVIGSRAYETDEALAAANDRLLDYVRAGGRLVVQYQQYQFVRGGFAPLALDIARPHDRVTDETAPMTPLVADHPIFQTPNRLVEADWEGWVQERGLYFAHRWDPGFTPLLSTHDPDGPDLQGGLLIARVGEGTYIYTGLAFFRQLPAGVVGAYRLFLNLLAAD